jgi:propanol-preferring alcohol dehydrogenase
MRYLEVSPGSAALREAPEPEIPAGWARVRVRACGICGTDLHLLRGMVLPPGVAYPLRPGHEVAGIVEDVNDDGASVRAGELVILHLLNPCGTCTECRRGQEQRCATARVLGIHEPGGLAETVVWPTARMLPAGGIEPAVAALLADAAATAYHALTLAQMPPGGTLCVLGAGGLGTSVLSIARALDPDVRLAAVVRTESSAARLSALGVETHVGLVDAARALRARVGRADAVVDFSGAAEAPRAGVGLLARGGRLVLGSVVDEPLALGSSSTFMTRELQVLGAYSSSLADLRAVIDLVRSGRLDASAWVTHRLPLTEAPAALALAAQRPAGTVRVVVECG